ncbi:toll/interleukin-1 receptor domain-containing protein [Streptomyces axinellae]|uniref:toll/interleukin-1 receptor domain-containing protein n=1 Tax=Streptomyces axinellae TaxID=552788 RepID=UPI0031E290A9
MWDVFFSYSRGDAERVRPSLEVLRGAGLKVFTDETGVAGFSGISRTIRTELARSYALLAFYSREYPEREACQWELTAAYLAGLAEGDPRARVMVVNPERGAATSTPWNCGTPATGPGRPPAAPEPRRRSSRTYRPTWRRCAHLCGSRSGKGARPVRPVTPISPPGCRTAALAARPAARGGTPLRGPAAGTVAGPQRAARARRAPGDRQPGGARGAPRSTRCSPSPAARCASTASAWPRAAGPATVRMALPATVRMAVRRTGRTGRTAWAVRPGRSAETSAGTLPGTRRSRRRVRCMRWHTSCSTAHCGCSCPTWHPRLAAYETQRPPETSPLDHDRLAARRDPRRRTDGPADPAAPHRHGPGRHLRRGLRAGTGRLSGSPPRLVARVAARGSYPSSRL